MIDMLFIWIPHRYLILPNSDFSATIRPFCSLKRHLKARSSDRANLVEWAEKFNLI